MSLETDLETLAEYLADSSDVCRQDVAANYRTGIARLSAKKAATPKAQFRYVKNAEGEIIMDCTFKVGGNFFGFFSIHRCNGQEKWSKSGTYYLSPLFGNGGGDYDCGAIHGLNEAKALASLNTRLIIAALQNVTLK